ncbi:UDP-N-acetylmuramate dehydrogenase [Cyanobacterium aponinum FACHB-4101]|uniref:UDP-N-acetylmuramate dehydrogenase n=1 Tax=Cyanobacterium aponinum TaxID=379064 RepID=UPI001680F4B6|nr:UDP-N-acetylmuramate dehydrogenase [Cyanobacterium aponinum]MBD2394960.1 UDP-N-acetylmuramate dehydrogenase [Cyanobacterium aponinum FACHB-4101]
MDIVKKNVLLAPYTTWKIGGPALYFAEPIIKELPELIRWATTKNIPIYFLGRGSNVLINDTGLTGLVILTRNSLNELRRESDLIVAGSGVFLPHLSQFAAKQGFSGFEFLIGIPGTVGGAVAMNAGLTVYRPREMTAIVKDFDVLNLDGSIKTLTMEDVKATYRHTDILDRNCLILQARFLLQEPGNPDEIKVNTFAHLAERKRKQPLDKPTAGSTFKSPPGSKGAGWYIEQAGLKGFQIGGARVSPVHANWIENIDRASSNDVWKLITHIQNVVLKEMGINLETEIKYLR